MELAKKKATCFGALHLVLEMSPMYASLRIVLTVIEALASSGALALVVANFVDTAMLIFEDSRAKSDIYPELVILLVVLGIFTTFGAVEQLVDARIRLDIQRKMKPAFVHAQASLEFKHIENNKHWELISRVTRDPATSLMDGFSAFVLILQSIISITSVFGLLITRVWWAVIVILAFSVPMFWLSLRAGKKNYSAAKDAEKFNRRTEYLDEVLTGRENVEERRLFGYGKEVSSRWEKQYEAGRKLQLKVELRQFLTTKGSSLMLALISVMITFTLIQPVATGALSAGMFMGIVSTVFGIINKLAWQLSSAMERVSRIGEYMNDLNDFLELSQTKDALVEPDAQPLEFTRLEFKNVRFRYPNSDQYTLNGLSFTLEKGHHYAFVGKNGAGKSTITKLLTGLYTDYEGEILINGRELREYPASNVKAMFSIVYQDFAKYSISLRDNIALGDIKKMETADVERIIRSTGLEDMVDGLNKGINTPLGKIQDEGQDLSGGQWQRVAIARSLISRAPIKILDEPTAALDPISESKIYKEFEKLMNEKTTIFISHRLGSTKLADEILVVDGGTIVERGTHDELMAANGQYAEMYESQRSWYQ